MKVSIAIGGAASGRQRDFEAQVEFVVEAEKLGVDTVWTAEAWGHDAISPLAFVAARTNRIRLGTGIMQISARTPSMTAMTAMTMAAISGDRFILGLGVSGPQVVEGLQGRPFAGPLTRLKETIEIVRMAFAGEKIEYHGKYHDLPRPGGKARRCVLLNQPIRISRFTWQPWVPHLWNTPARRPMAGWVRHSPLNTPMRIWHSSVPARRALGAAWRM